MLDLIKKCTYLDAPNDGSGGGSTNGTEGSPDANNKPANEKPADGGNAEKLFTQDDVNRIVQDRLNRQEKSTKDKILADIEAERRKNEMSEAERLKTEKTELENRIKQAQDAANAQVVSAKAEAIAAIKGVKPESIKHVLKLADLAGVSIGEDGAPDVNSITNAIDAVLKDVPAFAGKVGGNVDAGAGSGNQTVDYDKMTMEEYVKHRQSENQKK